ncbi:MAG: DNA-directed RNA polymerase subunit omega [Oculatellaceae cyanobacterium Prado106]|jgi:DNA-directed RNA polymerase subunit omega|nr:DNA-directed RNA polymerase subunit omega [Oculatellaceae cyanobacterium Prado106]
MFVSKNNNRSGSAAKRNANLDTSQLMRRAEDLVNAASNRYRITVQVATRAQRRRFEEFDSMDDPKMKPVIRAIVEMSDELTQPEIIGE